MKLVKRLDRNLDPTVFLWACALTGPFLVAGALFPDGAARAASAVLDHLTSRWDWLYLGSVSLFLAAAVAIALSPLGRIRLGRDGEQPEFRRVSWFAMLFSAGMGIGLVFWSVAEPMTHFTTPPAGQAGTPAAARLAFEIFFFHWGLHAWGTYVVVGLAMALSQYRKGRPALVSSCLVPLLGERFARGGGGRTVDVLAIWATIMGVVTSLGLGTLQVASGLNASLGTPTGGGVNVVVIAGITCLFLVSAVTGIKRGIKLLSLLNVGLMVFVLAYFAGLGPTRYIVETFVAALGRYLADLPGLSTSRELFGNLDWTRGWTVFYWAWWIAWAPFVGAFIARISRGRSVREFIGVVLVLPALFSFLFASCLGGTAVYQDLFQGGSIGALVSTNLEGALFETLRHLPGFTALAVVANVLIISFFVTSADSATYVISSLSTGGSPAPDRRLVVFWGCALGAMAAVLLTVGGLKALQTASIVGSFPFVAVMWLLLAATVRDLLREHRAARARSGCTAASPAPPA